MTPKGSKRANNPLGEVATIDSRLESIKAIKPVEEPSFFLFVDGKG